MELWYSHPDILTRAKCNAKPVLIIQLNFWVAAKQSEHGIAWITEEHKKCSSFQTNFDLYETPHISKLEVNASLKQEFQMKNLNI